MFVCRFGVEISRYISVVSQRDIYVKERYVREECELVNLIVE